MVGFANIVHVFRISLISHPEIPLESFSRIGINGRPHQRRTLIDERQPFLGAQTAVLCEDAVYFQRLLFRLLDMMALPKLVSHPVLGLLIPFPSPIQDRCDHLFRIVYNQQLINEHDITFCNSDNQSSQCLLFFVGFLLDDFYHLFHGHVLPVLQIVQNHRALAVLLLKHEVGP